MNGKMLFHPESFIPRTVRVGVSAQALGQAVDFIEVDARMEGLETAVGKFFTDTGYLSKDFIMNALNIPNDIPDEKERERDRRDVVEVEDEEKLKNLDNQVGTADIL